LEVGSEVAESALPATTETFVALGAQVRKAVPSGHAVAPMATLVFTRPKSTGT
jgi:hypothetical protein